MEEGGPGMIAGRGAVTRGTFAVAIVLAFGAGAAVGWLAGSGGAGDVPETVYAVDVGQSPQIGPANAPVTIVVFSDFQCPYCRQAGKLVHDLADRYGGDVRIAFKHFPMTRLHPSVPLAHEAAAAAAAQGKFWEFHDALFAAKGPFDRADLDGIASGLGLDMARFSRDLDEHAWKSVVDGDAALGEGLGVQGTPTLFVNGRKVIGANAGRVEKVVRYEIRHARAMVESGVAPDRIYDTILLEGLSPVVRKPASQPLQVKPPKPDGPEIYRADLGNSTLIGNPEAPVTLVAFIDYQCAFSAQLYETLRDLMKQHGEDLRVAFKMNPQPRHPGAVLAAEAVLAAGAQGKFLEMHDLLFAHREAQARPDLDGYARSIGLDTAAFGKALDGHEFMPIVQQDQALALSLDATSTPTIFVNGLKLKGNQPAAAIEEAIAKGKAMAVEAMKAGVAAKDVYAKIIENGIAGSTPPGPLPPGTEIPF